MKVARHLPNFTCVEHPLIQHKLSLMREVQCTPHTFRTLLHEIALLMGYELSRNLRMTERRIRTPLTEMMAPTLDEPAPCIVPVLRAGLGMADALIELIPTAQVGHIGVYRDHKTKQAIEYLVRLPENVGQTYFVVDPMLATGNSLVHVCDVLVKHGVAPDKIRVMTLVSVPEGVTHFHAVYPQIPVYSAALDEKLDHNAYILPGLGDAGDRIFGTL